MKLIVVENNTSFNERISKIANDFFYREKVDTQILSFVGYNKKLKEIIYNYERNIYILDIKLDYYSGYDIIREIREGAHDWESIIIVASVYNLKEDLISMRFSILTYLMKLNNFDYKLKEALKTSLDIFESQGFLTLNDDSQLFNKDILYVMKEKNTKYCIIKTWNDEFRLRKSLYKLQNELHLTKVKKYLLINERNVASVNGNEITLKNKVKVSID